jgi:hypothetical protein
VKIVIVGKTHMWQAACIGAMEMETGQSLRLLTAGGTNHPADTPYNVGGVWEITVGGRPEADPPHVEDVLVYHAELLDETVGDLKGEILRWEKPWLGSPNNVYDNLIRATSNGSGYISKSVGLPNRSTGYWISDKPLTLDGERYTYPALAGVRRMTYVGFVPAIATIPAGTLIRVSLARWWRPQDVDDSMEERCYLQLSGWF